MMAWWRWPLRLARVAARAIAFVAALAIAFVFFEPVDYALKYLHFSALSKERLIHQAKVYIRDRAGGNQMACLYVVECDVPMTTRRISINGRDDRMIPRWDLSAIYSVSRR